MMRTFIVAAVLVAAGIGATALAGGGPPPPNDDFPGTLIAGGVGSQAGTNVGATKQDGEPDAHGVFDGSALTTSDLGGTSVWYEWTSATDGTICFGTDDVSFDTTLGAWTGVTVGSLNEVAFNDDIEALNGLDIRSRITFTAAAGTTYHVGVGGYGARTGTFTLIWREDCILPNTTVTSAKAGKNAVTVSFTGSDNITPPAGLTFECQLDFGGYVGCTSPYTFVNVPGGPHVVRVRATDAAGNVDSTPSRADVRVRGK